MINSQCRLYLRASTKDQDEQRARFALEQFAAERQLSIVGVYADSISGTKIDRPALAKLLDEAEPGDVLLCESVDRLSRLSRADWRRLRQMIEVSFSEGDCTSSLGWPPCVHRTSDRERSEVLCTKRRERSELLRTLVHGATKPEPPKIPAINRQAA